MKKINQIAKQYQVKLGQQYPPATQDMGTAQKPDMQAIINNIKSNNEYLSSLARAIIQLRSQLAK